MAADGADGDRAVTVRARQWVLEWRLYRRNWSDVVGVPVRVVSIRLYVAAVCLISMVLMAWIGAFARVLVAQDWHASTILSNATLLTASEWASGFQGALFPVLLVWAGMLLLTPNGFTAAFHAAAVAACALGYLYFLPPAFPVTSKAATVSRWLDQEGGHPFVLYFVGSVALAALLQLHAGRTFRRLRPVNPASFEGHPYGLLVCRLCAMPLILAVLLATVWAAAVIRLAAADASLPGPEASYGFHAALVQDNYLFVLTLMAVLIAQLTSNDKWLIAAVALAAVYGLLPSTGPFHTKTTRFFLFPPTLEFSAWRGQLTRMGTAWGADTLWAALFLFVPGVVLGIYLVARLLHSPRSPLPG
jgi:hypothetical protein